jgi:prepilin signal peptidase PulO-like enzyme (type II secretory pathway)
MDYIVTGLCLILSGIIGVLAFSSIDYFKKPDRGESNDDASVDSSEITMSESGKPPVAEGESAKSVASIFRSIKKSLTTKRLILLSIGAVANLMVAFRMSGYELTLSTELKIVFSLSLLLGALIIDRETRRIPNALIIGMIGLRVVFLLPEYFLYRDDFITLLLASVLGLVGCFIIMLILSLITKGGIGMGDVKLISAVGCLSGIAASFYTLVYGMFACMICALVLLALGKKKMKDHVPFGPFVYFGYAVAISIGTF